MMIRNILILTVIAVLVPTAMSNVSASAGSEIALFSRASVDTDSLSITGNGDSAKMELKATNDDGKSNRISDFRLTADNVLSTEVGDKVTVIDNVDFTKAITTDVRNNQMAIGITSNGVIDFAGYNQGAYTLDVVVDDDRAYEAIIAIGDQTNQIVDKEITRVNSDYTINVELPLVCDEGYHRENGKCVPDDPTPEPPCDPESDTDCPEPPPIIPYLGDPADPCSLDPTDADCEIPEPPIVDPVLLPLEELPKDEEPVEGGDILPLVSGENTVEIPNDPVEEELPEEEEAEEEDQEQDVESQEEDEESEQESEGESEEQQ
jgi:hypothetical protein